MFKSPPLGHILETEESNPHPHTHTRPILVNILSCTSTYTKSYLPFRFSRLFHLIRSLIELRFSPVSLHSWTTWWTCCVSVLFLRMHWIKCRHCNNSCLKVHWGPNITKKTMGLFYQLVCRMTLFHQQQNLAVCRNHLLGTMHLNRCESLKMTNRSINCVHFLVFLTRSRNQFIFSFFKGWKSIRNSVSI